MIAGSADDDARPLWVADGVLHGARDGDASTLCGMSTEGLHRFDDYDFESVTTSAGGCARCAAAMAAADERSSS